MITPESPDRQYSTRLRTAVVLTGSGTAGAYHAGVLKALHEAGIRIDLMAGRGAGAIGAMFGAIDGGQRLWEPQGFWGDAAVSAAYRWTLALRIAGWAAVTAAGLVLLPIALFGIGVPWAILGILLSLVGLTSASTAVTSAYSRWLEIVFAPAALPTVVPRLVLLAVLVALAGLAAGVGLTRFRMVVKRKRQPGGANWLIGSPLTARAMIERAAAGLWQLVRGAAAIGAPPRGELGRRYVELLLDNLGQPGFRELLVVAHDVDARRDLVFAALSGMHRTRFFARPTLEGTRSLEVFDLAGASRDHAFDALAASLVLPVATDPHLIAFAPDSAWRGEVHRACDRPAALGRLLEEVAVAGVEQVIVIAATPPAGRPHELTAGRADLRSRAGQTLMSSEAAALGDAMEQYAGRFAGLYLIRPAHNPVGPLDFSGTYDERSDRRQGLGEMIDRGYEDAYRQFIEPVVG